MGAGQVQGSCSYSVAPVSVVVVLYATFSEQSTDMLQKGAHLGSKDTGAFESSARCFAGFELPAMSPSAVRSSSDFWTYPCLVVQLEAQRASMCSVLGESMGARPWRSL